MSGIIAMAYGIAAYVFFLVTIVYAIGFVGGIGVPKHMDSGVEGPFLPSLLTNLCLLTLFAVQHSLMARPAFKRWWTQYVSKSVERSTYVAFASAGLALLMWQWQPMLHPVWVVHDPIVAAVIQCVFVLGWLTVFASTFLISHFELFGLQQVWQRLRNVESKPSAFRTPFLYGFVRHPIYLGFLIAFWATPAMSLGHLVFALATTGYIFVGIFLEERDLVDLFGESYREYRRRVGMIFPMRKQARGQVQVSQVQVNPAPVSEAKVG